MDELTVFSAIRSASLKQKAQTSLHGVDDRGGWWPIAKPEYWFQQDLDLRRDDAVLANWTIFSCMTLIAGDVGKLRLMLVEQDANGIWTETQSAAFSPVLRKPNRYQTRQKFIEQWLLSKLSNGNTYVLKERDDRGIVTALYVLDPSRVKPLIGPDGAVYYQLQGDDLAQIPTNGLPAVPASEIIHDRMWCLFHPLVGVSPIYANGLGASQALRIQNHSAAFFANMARPSGVLLAPTQISDETAKRLKDYWESNYTGANKGKLAVLGDNLKYQPMTQNAVDAELVEQLKLTAVMVCATFHVPPHMVGAGPVPTNNNVEALEVQYYSKALQGLIESIEALLDDGLGLTEKKDGKQLGTYFDLDDLLRMDQATLTSALKDQVGAGISSPNEARRRLNQCPTKGGDTPYLQEQNWPISQLAGRDISARPATTPAPITPPAAAPAAPEDDSAKEARALIEHITKGLELCDQQT